TRLLSTGCHQVVHNYPQVVHRDSPGRGTTGSAAPVRWAVRGTILDMSTNTTKFHELLKAQIRNEFTAAQQYVAIAVWFDDQDLPRLAAHFYRQSLEERNHAMMIVQYLLDNDVRVAIPGVGEVRN